MTALWPHKLSKKPSPGQTVYAMVTDNGSVAVATNAYAAVAMAFAHTVPKGVLDPLEHRRYQGEAAKMLKKNGVVVVSRKMLTGLEPERKATITRQTTNIFRGKAY